MTTLIVKTSQRPGKGASRSPSVVGQRFAKLLVIGQRIEGGRSVADCKCDCGNQTTIRLSRLFDGQSGCGCGRGKKSVRHGHAALGSSSPTYSSWSAMKDRCLTPAHVSWSRYGGRGITVCERWLSFDLFLQDMGPRPSLKHSLDRIESDGNYEPGNCRWATAKTQGRNHSGNKVLTHNGTSMCVAAWADQTGLPHNTIRRRLILGWTVGEALETPHRSSRGPSLTSARKSMTPARMQRIWEREKGICWFCTKPVPMRGGDVVRYDHRIPVEISQDDSDDGIYPIHREPCDRLKTAADQAKIAKTRRMSGEKGQQARRQKNGPQLKGRGFDKGGPKRKIPSRPFGR